jgi:flagellar assembly protein FliH
MSSKIAGPELARTAKLVSWPSVHGKPASPEIDNPSGAAKPQPAPDTAHLHARIVELEQLMQREVQAAYQRGRQEAEQAAVERASAETKPVLERLGRATAEIATLRTKIRRETEKDLVCLSIEIARRVMRRELSTDPEAIQGIVKAALEKVQAREVCRIRCHPAHEKAIRSCLERAGGLGHVDLSSDAAMQRGDLLVETKRGDLDASIDTQLREIERGFADRIG